MYMYTYILCNVVRLCTFRRKITFFLPLCSPHWAPRQGEGVISSLSHSLTPRQTKNTRMEQNGLKTDLKKLNRKPKKEENGPKKWIHTAQKPTSSTIKKIYRKFHLMLIRIRFLLLNHSLEQTHNTQKLGSTLKKLVFLMLRG